jgi:hypothetical protein
VEDIIDRWLSVSAPHFRAGQAVGKNRVIFRPTCTLILYRRICLFIGRYPEYYLVIGSLTSHEIEDKLVVIVHLLRR